MKRLASSLLVLASLAAVSASTWSISIGVSGSWSPTIDQGDLIGGAGSDLNSTYESAADQLTMSISDTQTGVDWSVDVRRVDSNWHSDFVLSVRRTGSGDGYQVVTTSAQTLFTGTGDLSAINLQLRLSGVSVLIPSATYSTTIYYTVTEVGI